MAEAAKKETPAPAKNEKGKEAPAQVTAAPAAVAAAAPTQPVKAKFDLLGLVVFLLVTLNLVAVGGMGFFLQKMWDQVQDLKANTQKLAERSEKEEEPAQSKESHAPQIGTLYPMDSFLVNITSDAGPKFLQTQMELELADPVVEEELSRKKAAIRDSVIVLLTSRTYKELRDPAGIKKLRADLLRVMNGLLTSGKIKEVYFTQFHFN